MKPIKSIYKYDGNYINIYLEDDNYIVTLEYATNETVLHQFPTLNLALAFAEEFVP